MSDTSDQTPAAAAGFDPADPETQKTVGYVLGIFERAQASLATGGSFNGLLNGGSPDLNDPSPMVQYSNGGHLSRSVIDMTGTWIALSLLIYAGGLMFRYRRVRRQSPVSLAARGAVSDATAVPKAPLKSPTEADDGEIKP